MTSCGYPTHNGPCPQFGAPGRCAYHRKIEAGLLQRADQVLDPVELEATMDGRLHGDGRRLDAYVTDVGAPGHPGGLDVPA